MGWGKAGLEIICIEKDYSQLAVYGMGLGRVRVRILCIEKVIFNWMYWYGMGESWVGDNM